MLCAYLLLSAVSAGLFWYNLRDSFSGEAALMSVLPWFMDGIILLFWGACTVIFVFFTLLFALGSLKCRLNIAVDNIGVHMYPARKLVKSFSTPNPPSVTIEWRHITGFSEIVVKTGVAASKKGFEMRVIGVNVRDTDYFAEIERDEKLKADIRRRIERHGVPYCLTADGTDLQHKELLDMLNGALSAIETACPPGGRG